MNPLILNIVVVSFISLCYGVIPHKNGYVKGIYLFATFCCLLYIRSMVDVFSLPDLEIYDEYYASIHQFSLKESYINGADGKIERGYVILNKLISYLSPNFRFFLWVYSFILLLLYYKFFTETSPYLAISVLLLLVGPFNQSLFVLRQHMAVALLLASYGLIRDRKCIQFLIVLFIAFSFHRTALIFLPVYFLYGLSRKKLIRSAIVIAIFSFVIFGIVLNYFAALFSVYDTYMAADVTQNYKSALIAGFFLFLYIYILREHVFDEGIKKFSLILLSLYFIFSLSGIGAVSIVGRLAVYFSVGLISAIPIVLYYTKDRIWKLMIFIIVFGIQFYITFIGSTSQYIESMKMVSPF